MVSSHNCNTCLCVFKQLQHYRLLLGICHSKFLTLTCLGNCYFNNASPKNSESSSIKEIMQESEEMRTPEEHGPLNHLRKVHINPERLKKQTQRLDGSALGARHTL